MDGRDSGGEGGGGGGGGEGAAAGGGESGKRSGVTRKIPSKESSIYSHYNAYKVFDFCGCTYVCTCATVCLYVSPI